jgi:hypothetical protein
VRWTTVHSTCSAILLSFRNGQCNPQMAVPSKRGSWSEWMPGRRFDIRDGTVDFATRTMATPRIECRDCSRSCGCTASLASSFPGTNASTLVNSRSRNHIQSLVMLAMHAPRGRVQDRINTPQIPAAESPLLQAACGHKPVEHLAANSGSDSPAVWVGRCLSQTADWQGEQILAHLSACKRRGGLNGCYWAK